MRNPVFLILIGFVLVLLAVILSWMIVLGYIPSSFPLDISVFAMSMGGLMLGIVGAATYVKFTVNKRKKEE
jgi:hypothetical protein